MNRTVRRWNNGVPAPLRSRGPASDNRGRKEQQMDATLKTIIWRQFGAAIDMLENAMRACPEVVWSDRTRQPEFWYIAFHTLFYLDCYLSESLSAFAPPPPFTL